MHEHSVSTCQVRNVLGTGIKNEEDKIPSSQSLRSEAGLDTKAQNKVDMGCCGSRAETLDPAGIPREDVLRGVLGAKESCQCRPWTKAREVWSHMSQVQRYRCWILLQLNMQRGGAMWGETMSSTRGVPRAHSQLPAHRSCGFLLHLRHWTCFLCHGDSGDLSYRNTDTDFHKSHKNSSSLKKKKAMVTHTAITSGSFGFWHPGPPQRAPILTQFIPIACDFFTRASAGPWSRRLGSQGARGASCR